MNIQNSSGFKLVCDFEKSARDPEKLFHSMGFALDCLVSLDKILIPSLNIKVVPRIILDDLQIGSLTGFFKYTLENIPDEYIANLEFKKIIGLFLVKAKYK